MKKIIAFVAISMYATAAFSEDHSQHQHSDHSAINSSVHHSHGAGEWMFTYQYMQMKMEGMRDGTDDLSDQEVLADFMVTPTDMTMEMHMFSVMYGLSDDLTVMAMLPYHNNEMAHVTRMGMGFTTRSEGVGDVKLIGLYNMEKDQGSQLQLKVGLSVPSGDIDAKDDTPAMKNAPLPYPMQLGSGSWDILPGIIYFNSQQDVDWGAEANAIIRLNDNDNDYRLGNRLEISGWASKPLNSDLSGVLRVKGLLWDNIDGNDSRLNPAMVPTADPDNQGGKRIDLSAGLQISPVNGMLKGQTFSA
ncbi:MAG: transporter, partial [Gammaproteobacteria bacterium]